MATIAIGDIHGNYEALDDLLRMVAPELESSDVVVFLGDYVDRGPDTKQCVDCLLAFEAQCRATVIGLLQAPAPFADLGRHRFSGEVRRPGDARNRCDMSSSPRPAAVLISVLARASRRSSLRKASISSPAQA